MKAGELAGGREVSPAEAGQLAKDVVAITNAEILKNVATSADNASTLQTPAEQAFALAKAGAASDSLRHELKGEELSANTPAFANAVQKLEKLQNTEVLSLGYAAETLRDTGAAISSGQLSRGDAADKLEVMAILVPPDSTTAKVLTQAAEGLRSPVDAQAVINEGLGQLQGEMDKHAPSMIAQYDAIKDELRNDISAVAEKQDAAAERLADSASQGPIGQSKGPVEVGDLSSLAAGDYAAAASSANTFVKLADPEYSSKLDRVREVTGDTPETATQEKSAQHVSERLADFVDESGITAKDLAESHDELRHHMEGQDASQEPTKLEVLEAFEKENATPEIARNVEHDEPKANTAEQSAELSMGE
jgi:hypothetical protein